jgi:hypothetical protein
MVWVDCHVHVYPCFSIERLLAAAVANMGGGAAGAARMLLLSESAGHNVFAAWRAAAGGSVPGAAGWRVARTGEDCTLALLGPGGAGLLVVAGRQVATSERLEVLALGTTEMFEDSRRGIAGTIEAVASAGALPVVPWGAGKWLGARGRLLDSVISGEGARFALADNSGRPWIWPEPRHFRTAGDRGIAILAGSDPLPLAGEEARVGLSGFVMDGNPDAAAPFAWLSESVMARAPSRFGRREGVMRFLRNQTAIRTNKARMASR